MNRLSEKGYHLLFLYGLFIANLALASPRDTLRINDLLEHSKSIQNSNQDSSFLLATEAYQLSKNENYKKGIGTALIRLGSILIAKGNNDSALVFIKQAFEIRKSLEDNKGASGACILLSYIYNYLGKKDSAFASLYEALRLNQKSNDSINSVQIYVNIGYLDIDYGNPKEALGNFEKAAELSQIMNYKEGLLMVYNAFGGYYFNKKEYKKALNNYFKYDTISKLNADSVSNAQNLNNIALCYQNLNNIELASVFYKKALDSYIKLDMKNELANGYYNLGGMYNNLNQPDSAIYLLKKGLIVSRETQDFKITVDCFNALSMAYYLKKDYLQAYNYHVQYAELSDSLLNEEKVKQIAEMQTKYETGEKEATIKLQEKQAAIAGIEAKRKNQILILVLIGLFSVIVFSVFMFNRWRITQKQKNIIAIQKEEAEQLRARAEQSEKFKQQFLANMSHEIRSPMNAALGAVTLASKQNNSVKTNEYLDTAQRSTKNLLRIINDILDLSKIEVGKMTLEKELFYLEDVVKDVIALNLVNANHKNIKLETILDSSACIFVKGDIVRVSQVINNLISNSVKFTEKGSVIAEFNMKTAEPASSSLLLYFTIKDSGIGMSSEQINNLFQSYTQATASTTRKYGGTGLGLSITKELVALMNGTIDVESEQGNGTTFEVTIPLEKPTEKEIEKYKEHEKKEKSGNIHSDKQLTIFIADDMEDNRKITKDLLHQIFPKSNIHISSNGNELIEQLLNSGQLSKDTCILLDLDMPVMNGFEAAKKIREELKLTVPVFALTASVFITDENEIKTLGFDKLITKPFVPAELAKNIVEAIAMKG